MKGLLVEKLGSHKKFRGSYIIWRYSKHLTPWKSTKFWYTTASFGNNYQGIKKKVIIGTCTRDTKPEEAGIP